MENSQRDTGAHVKTIAKIPQFSNRGAIHQKTYYGLSKLSLPDPDPHTKPFQDILSQRKSVREFKGKCTLAELSGVLAGARKSKTELGHYRSPVPSGGALYPLEIYVVSFAVIDLLPGVYHYSSTTHSLTRLPSEDAPLLHYIKSSPDESKIVAEASFANFCHSNP